MLQHGLMERFLPKNTGLPPVRHVLALQGRWTPVVKRNGGAVFVMFGILSQAIWQSQCLKNGMWGGRLKCPPQRGSVETITINVRQEHFPLHTRFYNFANEVWIEPTNLSGKLALACLAAWFNTYNNWSQIVFLHLCVWRRDEWLVWKWGSTVLAIKLNGF